jgi:hypothetical protein
VDEIFREGGKGKTDLMSAFCLSRQDIENKGSETPFAVRESRQHFENRGLI